MSEEKEVKGCFIMAIQQLIGDLVEGDLNYSDMLYRWDQARGTDWVTETKRQQMSKQDQ